MQSFSNIKKILIFTAFIKSVFACLFNIAYCIDGSGSITYENPTGYDDEKNFLVDYNNQITKSSEESFLKTMAEGFAETFVDYFDYNDFDELSQVNDALLKIEPPSKTGETKIGGCMNKVYTNNRPNDLATVLLVVTDGNPFKDTYDVKEMSATMRSDNFFIQAAGFNDINYDILNEITGDQDMIIYSKNVTDLDKKIKQLTDDICKKSLIDKIFFVKLLSQHI
ncbi:biological adhesion [Bonamia ostreae]|uniref:Biological adhesion n=1 Tax=Bonamia ostreae TaxID=126728 RepID=A0ABV2AKL2_9EUKA